MDGKGEILNFLKRISSIFSDNFLRLNGFCIKPLQYTWTGPEINGVTYPQPSNIITGDSSTEIINLLIKKIIEYNG